LEWQTQHQSSEIGVDSKVSVKTKRRREGGRKIGRVCWNNEVVNMWMLFSFVIGREARDGALPATPKCDQVQGSPYP